MHVRERLTRWLRQGNKNSFCCPACQTSLPPEKSFCPHCYMVLRPEGMAELQEALQGAKVREDVYILRRLHHGSEEDGVLVTHAAASRSAPVSFSPRGPEVATSPPEDETGVPPHTATPQRQDQKAPGPQDLPALIRWFLHHDRNIPNNLAMLEDGYRILYRDGRNWTYERHLAWVIGDDLRTYDSRDLLEEHLTLLTTVYARTVQALRSLGADRPGLRSPTELPEEKQQEMWRLCLQLGLTATRLRVEGWIYQERYGEPLKVKKMKPKRRPRGRAAPS